MNKKEYMKRAIELDEFDLTEQLLAFSVQSNGLGEGDELTQDETPGDSWDEAVSRHGIWGDEEL